MLPVDQLIDERASSVRDIFGLQRMVKDVREALDRRSKKELHMMANKNQQMTHHLNQLKYENGQSSRRLEALKLELKKDGQCYVKKGDADKMLLVCPVKLGAEESVRQVRGRVRGRGEPEEAVGEDHRHLQVEQRL